MHASRKSVSENTRNPRRYAGTRGGRGFSRRAAAIAATAALALSGAIGLVLSAPAGPAGAATQLSWVMGGGNIGRMGQQDLATTSHFFDTPASYGTGGSLVASPVPAKYGATPVLTYTSYAEFSSDIQNGNISYPYNWVLYDPESWDQTPLNEQQNPVKYMKMFGQLAHAHGLKAIEAPARDLAYVSGSAYPRRRGESCDAWFIRVNIAGAAATYGDTFVLQDEANEANLSAYQSLFTKTRAEALAANPNVKVFSEVSTVNGTPDQMAAAARSVSPSGFYVAAPGATDQALQFFSILAGAGY